MGEFIIPEFMQNEDVESILSRMFDVLPETISKEENGWVSDLFTPVALEISRAVEFVLIEAIKNIIPRYSYGDILLGHAENRNIQRRPASYARAVLTVKGIKNTVIPEGFMFSTVSTEDKPNVIFKTEKEYIIPESGETKIDTVCTNSGTTGSTSAETIILMVKPLEGILSVVNEKPSYDGFDEESEESLRNRIAEYDLTQGTSFIGCISDYRRWAMEVEGVGNAEISGAEDDTGTVKIILTDLYGQPVSDEICQNVYNHIMKPDSPYDRLAPVNAVLDVVSAEPVNIQIDADIDLETGYTMDVVKPVFIENIRKYLASDSARTEVKYAETGAVLINTEGVADYNNLLINGGCSNINIETGFVAVIHDEDVTFS